MTYATWAIIAAMASGLFGGWGAFHVWRGSLRSLPDGNWTAADRDLKTLVVMLLAPSFASISAALSVAAVISA